MCGEIVIHPDLEYVVINQEKNLQATLLEAHLHSKRSKRLKIR
jgi:hypothetical protein